MNLKKVKFIGPGEDCPRCGLPMWRVTHKELTDKIKSKGAYYTAWDYCPKCKEVEVYKEFEMKSNRIESSFHEMRNIELEVFSGPDHKEFVHILPPEKRLFMNGKSKRAMR